jgi:hypothetical protein
MVKKSLQKPQGWELNIMPRNLNEIVRSWIRHLYITYRMLEFPSFCGKLDSFSLKGEYTLYQRVNIWNNWDEHIFALKGQ